MKALYQSSRLQVLSFGGGKTAAIISIIGMNLSAIDF
jgi:hypothetical protein